MSQSIVIEGVSVVAARGANPTHASVLLIPGYFADARVFDRWLPFLAARGFAAYAVNFRGRRAADGLTARDVGRVSIADYVDEASRVARALGKPSVVGHSMGGLIAQKLAERDEVAAAALLSPAPPRGIFFVSRRLVATQLKYLPAIVASRPLAPRRSDAYDLVLNRVAPADREAIFRQFVPDSGRAAREMSWSGVPVDASRVRCPVLVIAGDDDRFIPHRVAERVAARYHAPLQTVVGHGHMLPLEPGWEAIADAVARWLTSVSLSS